MVCVTPFCMMPSVVRDGVILSDFGAFFLKSRSEPNWVYLVWQVGATGGAALYYSVATRRSAPLQPQAPSEKPTLLDLPIVRLIAPRAAQCEGGDNTLLYGLAAAVAAGGLAYVKFGQVCTRFGSTETTKSLSAGPPVPQTSHPTALLAHWHNDVR